MIPIREIIEPIVAAVVERTIDRVRQPVCGHPRFPRYVEEVAEPVPEITILTAYEEIICNQTGAALHTVRTLGRLAAEIALNARHTA